MTAGHRGERGLDRAGQGRAGQGSAGQAGREWAQKGVRQIEFYWVLSRPRYVGRTASRVLRPAPSRGPVTDQIIVEGDASILFSNRKI